MSMPHRLFRLLAFALIALLPSQASYATVSCAPMQMEMEAAPATDECGGCPENFADSCRLFCGMMCQSLLVSRLAALGESRSPDQEHIAPTASFLVIGIRGPDPPPPRLDD
ncbi:hypothetical protein BSY18_4040 (plasmid) [Blastomonas sp. RAC04]|nr:hypothetical protein BSY18_4040 [Blastomonas sp. RAC04]